MSKVVDHLELFANKAVPHFRTQPTRDSLTRSRLKISIALQNFARELIGVGGRYDPQLGEAVALVECSFAGARRPQGILKRISGILLARPMKYSQQMTQTLYVEVRRVLAEFRRDDLPVVASMDFGHTSPQMVVPIGCRAAVDCGHNFSC